MIPTMQYAGVLLAFLAVVLGIDKSSSYAKYSIPAVIGGTALIVLGQVL
jgi:hypothetical protein